MTTWIELYSTPLCPFSHRSRLTLAEKGLSARVIDIDLRNKPADFVALTPFAEVPVLKVGDHGIWDCAVIDEYLEELAPAPALLPADPVARARTRAWIRFADQRLYPDTKRFMLSPDAQSRAAAMTPVQDNLRFMHQHAFGPRNVGPYWMGPHLTLADLTFIPWFEQSPALEVLLGFIWPAETEGLRRWYESVATRPAVASQSRPPEFYVNAYGRMMRPQ